MVPGVIPPIVPEMFLWLSVDPFRIFTDGSEKRQPCCFALVTTARFSDWEGLLDTIQEAMASSRNVMIPGAPGRRCKTIPEFPQKNGSFGQCVLFFSSPVRVSSK